MNFIQQAAFEGAFGQGLFQDTGSAGTFYEISDFKIVFKFILFLGHFSLPMINQGAKSKLRSLSQAVASHKPKKRLKRLLLCWL
jgi:hypothetical protein